MMLVVGLTFGASNFIFSDIEEGEKISEVDANIQKRDERSNEMFTQLPSE
jgi:hypothetical protein